MTSIQRIWAMPHSDTFDIEPIGKLVKRYLSNSLISVDPFARNKVWATYTNDLNPDTKAEYHLDAYDFLVMLRDEGVKTDLVIFDPPYSRQQVKEVYQNIGRHYGIEDSQEHTTNWSKERDIIDEILQVHGHVLSFGWNSSGMGKVRTYRSIEIILVNHGGGRNDTIVTVEMKQAEQIIMFDLEALRV